MTVYQKSLATRAPEMNPLHMETLAYAMAETLNGKPAEFFDMVAAKARKMGAAKLAKFHERETC